MLFKYYINCTCESKVAVLTSELSIFHEVEWNFDSDLESLQSLTYKKKRVNREYRVVFNVKQE